LKTVASYSVGDKRSPFFRIANGSVPVAPPESSIDRIAEFETIKSTSLMSNSQGVIVDSYT